ncbi:HlyD family secretion protein, partial [Vibrio ichthyoenteri ATCC 700023]
MADSMFHQISSNGIQYKDSRQLSFKSSFISKMSLAVVLVMLFGFLLWATFAKLSSAAIAPGVIIVESKRKPIQHLEGGIVKTIHIADGQAVAQGDLLITLDASQAHAQLHGLRAQWQSDLARLNRLQAELSDQTQIQFDPRLLELTHDPRVQTILDTQAKLFDKRRSLRSGEDKILNEKIAQANLDLDGLRKRYQADEQGLVYLNEQLEMHETLLET